MEIQRNYFKNLSEEEKATYKDKRNWYARATYEQKAAHAQKTKDRLVAQTPEQKAEISRKNSEGLKRHWETVSEEDRIKRTRPMIEAAKLEKQQLSKEELSKRARTWYDKLSPEEQLRISQEYRDRMIAYNASLSLEEKQARAQRMYEWHQNLTPEEKEELYRRTHEWYFKLSDMEKADFAKSQRSWYENMTPEEFKTWRQKVIQVSQENNSLHKRFEETFMNSHLINQFTFQKEVLLGEEVQHAWDYGIIDQSTGELVMVVDLDGSFFHADRDDYTGIQSREEMDERRPLSIPPGVKSYIIPEMNFTKAFQDMIKMLMLNYDEYIDEIFKECRMIPFPYPEYNTQDLIRCYFKLRNMKVDDSLHGDVSLNTRVGDHIIQTFHQSIYHAHRNGKPSPYEAWHRDDMLRECIENRIIFQNHLNPNKILQGFNVSKIAPKVSVFSAGRAKIIISKYLNEYDTIFDPFSGFSGRMLGAISLDKDYLGQDISPAHVDESNKILEFFREHEIAYLAEVIQQDVFRSYGEYPCLFTCPLYGNKEQWVECPLKNLSCDEWILLCLKHFRCRRYVFVVDKTEAFRENIATEILTKSSYSVSNEFIVIIDR